MLLTPLLLALNFGLTACVLCPFWYLAEILAIIRSKSPSFFSPNMFLCQCFPSREAHHLFLMSKIQHLLSPPLLSAPTSVSANSFWVLSPDTFPCAQLQKYSPSLCRSGLHHCSAFLSHVSALFLLIFHLTANVNF